jgi:hypothetical protein
VISCGVADVLDERAGREIPVRTGNRDDETPKNTRDSQTTS